MAQGERLRTGQFRAPLKEALDTELHRFERLTARVWQLFAGVAVMAGAIFALSVAPELGVACGATAGVFLAWFVFLGWRLERGRSGPVLRLVSTIVESSLPWVFSVVLLVTEGPEYALASWVPPMLFCALILAFTARLRPRACLVVGIVGGVAHPLLYLLLMKLRLTEPFAEEIIYQTPMQVTRGVSLVFAGAIAMFLTRGLRDAIARAEIVVRERDLFGKYRLVAQIASGGMGSVFEGVYCPEGGFERRVAVKRIHEHLVSKARFVDDFRSEAEIGARLAHPNIVQVLDFGRVGRSYFLAMEYVDGMPLSVLMARVFARQGTIAPHVVGYVGREILAGLAHAHEGARGTDGKPLHVVHRDMCPHNVLLSKNGEVKITDFGVARALRESAASYTQTVVGHLSYIAPEQASGRAVDARADLFPVGVILWEMLAGRRLFYRKEQSATLHALLHDEVVPVTMLRPDLDPAWHDFLERALAREPEARFASAREMAEALDALPGSRADGAGRELAELVTETANLPDEDTATVDAATTVADVPSAIPTPG